MQVSIFDPDKKYTVHLVSCHGDYILKTINIDAKDIDWASENQNNLGKWSTQLITGVTRGQDVYLAFTYTTLLWFEDDVRVRVESIA